jgi:RNA polymerase sigma factor (sigma-70 family)
MTTSKRALPSRILQMATSAPTSDAELLARFVQSHDEAAFAAIVERHGPMVLGVCRRMLGDAHAAEDAFQAAFFALSRGAGKLRVTGSLAAWLYGAAVRVSLKARGIAARDRRVPTRSSAISAPDPLAEITGRELVSAIDEELFRLPETLRAAVTLCCLEGLSQEEAARQLGWSAGSVKGRLERGRERLRTRLARRGIALSASFGGLLLADARAAVPPHLFARAVELPAVGNPPPGMVELAACAMPAHSTWKLLAIAVVLLVAGSVIEVGRGDPPQQPQTPSPISAGVALSAAEPTDRFGDPLPAGAILRLGTIRLRQPLTFSLAFTHDNKLASFGGDYVARVWDPTNGQLLRKREFEEDLVSRQHGGWLSPDAKKLAVQHQDCVRVLDIEAGRELASVSLSNLFEAVARFSQDSTHLAVVDQLGKIQICNIGQNSSRELVKLGFPASPEFAFSKDGKRLALANYNTGAIVWDLATDREIVRFKKDGLAPLSVDFDSSGDFLAVLGAGPKQSIHFVQVSTGREPEGWITPPVGELNWVRFAPDDSTLMLGSKEGVTWFDPKTGKTIRTAKGQASLAPVLSSDGRMIASAAQNTLHVWDVETGRSVVPREIGNAPENEVHGVSISPDGNWILTKDEGTGIIRVWNTSGELKNTIKANRSGGRFPAFSPDGRYLYGPAPDTIALVRWDFPSGKESARYNFAEPANEYYIYNFTLSADGSRLAAITQADKPSMNPMQGFPERAVRFTCWDIASGRRETSRVIDEYVHLLGYGSFSPDVQCYVMGDRTVPLTGEAKLRLELPEGWQPLQAVMSPDGRLVAQAMMEYSKQTREDGKIVISTADRGVLIQEIATGKQVLNLGTGYCGPLIFTPDSRELIVTNSKAITRWDLTTQKPIVKHAAPGRSQTQYGSSFASSLALSRDGTRAVTGHIDTTALVWDISAPKRQLHVLNDQEMLGCWEQLTGVDAGKAYKAIWALADSSDEAVKFLRTRLHPVAAPTEAHVKKLIAQLGAEEFASREAAERELHNLGDTLVPVLRVALKAESPEQIRRIEQILASAEAPALMPGERLRSVRSVAVLELIGTKEALDLLTRLAGGAESARQTREAKVATDRLRHQLR